MKRHAIILAILLFSFVGCKKEPPPSETPPPPPPPTAQVLLGRVIQATQLNAPLPAPGSEIGRVAAAAWINTVQAEKRKLGSEPNGREAMGLVSREIANRARNQADLELWSFVMVMCMAHEIFEPGSDRLERLQGKAERELSKPVVTFSQLYDLGDGYLARVNMRLPLTGEVFNNVEMALGDIAHGVKFVSVIGRNAGIRIEYVEGGDQLDIMNKPKL